MTVLWMNFFVVYVSSFFSRYFARPLNNGPFVSPNKFFVTVVITTLVIVSGLRHDIGDTYFYMHSYSISQFPLQKLDFKGEFGFYILQSLLHHISNDPQILIFTTALVTNILIVIVLYKYSRMIEVSMYVFIASGLFTVSMNGLRQTLAASIIFAATSFILKGNWKGFMLVVLLASTIHNSALIFIPIYFIVRRKAWSKVTILLLGIAILVTLMYSTFSSLIFGALSDTEYGHYSTFSEGGANILRIAVTGVPLLIAFMGRKKLRELWPESDTIVNLSLLGFLFMIISYKDWIFARFDIYFELYTLILFSWIIPLFAKKQRYFVYYGLITCYFAYFLYEQVITLGIDYRSNYL